MKLQVMKLVWIALGSFFLALGVLGVFLPILPTTPFLLLTAFCYLRGSSRLYNWLINHRLFGPPIAEYLKYRAVSRKTKAIALSVLWSSMLLSMLLVRRLPLIILLATIGLIVSIYILRLRERVTA